MVTPIAVSTHVNENKKINFFFLYRKEFEIQFEIKSNRIVDIKSLNVNPINSVVSINFMQE